MKSVFYFLISTFYFGIASTNLAQRPANTQSSPKLSLPSRFTGTWKRVNGDETVTLSVNPDAVDGDGVVITNSSGAIGTGILKGEKILYTGATDTDEGKTKVAGVYVVSPDGISLIKLRKIIYNDRTEEETTEYDRVSPIMLPGPATPPPLLARAEDGGSTTTGAPKPSGTPVRSEPFVGTWRPADDSAKVTITVNGRNAILKYSGGSRQGGTIRGNKLECETESNADGLKSTDVFEMSSNGRTLIRRRTLQSHSGETGNETLTYNRAE